MGNKRAHPPSSRPGRRAAGCLLSVLLTQLAGSSHAVAQSQPSDPSQPRVVPIGQTEDPVRQATARREKQLRTLGEFKVFHEFRFRDRQPESGITFMHRVTEDSGKRYKPNHYDHGNGIVVADVDGDERYDIYFVNQIGANELFKNLGGGRFENITQSAGVGLADRVSATASFADVDNDGDADLYVSTVKFGNALFENDGRGHFKDITEQAGVAHTGHSSGVVFFDYDRDGLLDLFLTNVGTYTTDKVGPGGYYIGFGYLPGGAPDAFGGHLVPERFENSILYRNLGDRRFKDVSAETGLVDNSWSGDASSADLNRDGYPDLYVLNMQGDDHYYENVEGRKFVDKTAELFPKTPWGSMGIKFFDSNNDGLMDLLLTDMHSDMSQEVGPEKEKLKSEMLWPDEFLEGGQNNIFGNAFYRQRSDGKFEEVSDSIGLENYWPWGLSTGDLNADGYEDVFIASSMNFPFRYGVNSLLLNNRGEKFLDSEYILGVEPRRDGRAMKPWALMDCSGEDAEHLHCRGRSGKFQLLGTLGTRSSVIFDLDGDGDLDIVTNEFNSEPMVLISDLAEKTELHFLKIKLVGTRSNRDGLGATVRVTAGAQAYTKVLDGTSGYLSHSRLPLYFGLGDATGAVRVEVLWPSGRTQTVEESIPMNSLLEIVEEAD